MCTPCHATINKPRSGQPRPLPAASLFISLSLILLSACSPQTSTPIEVSLAELTAQPNTYSGRSVRTRGIVRSFPQPRHYWLEGALTQRVGLLPAERIAPHLDRQVSVSGQFSYSPARGRYLQIEHIEPFDPPR